MIDEKLSRRQLLQGALVSLAAVPAATLIAGRANAAEAVSADDPTAKSLGYVTDASKVVAASNPTYKPGQTCANCLQFKGKAGAADGPCVIFQDKLVKSKGWCKVWVPAAPKPA
ncbi:MAG: high-potential iron-sulfur protein [Steroidobacteraceae bacterium]